MAHNRNRDSRPPSKLATAAGRPRIPMPDLTSAAAPGSPRKGTPLNVHVRYDVWNGEDGMKCPCCGERIEVGTAVPVGEPAGNNLLRPTPQLRGQVVIQPTWKGKLVATDGGIKLVAAEPPAAPSGSSN